MVKYNLYIYIGIFSILYSGYDLYSTYSDLGYINKYNQMLKSNNLGDIYSLFGLNKNQFLIGIILLETIPGLLFIAYGNKKNKELKEILFHINNLVNMNSKKIHIMKIPNAEKFDYNTLIKYINKNYHHNNDVEFLL